MSELSFAHVRLNEAFGEVLRLEAEERVRRAYEHGYKAGLKVAKGDVDAAVYRRGYLTGYSSGKRLAECRPDGGARTGRPRALTIGVGS